MYSSKISDGGLDCILTEGRKKLHGTLKSFPLKVQKNQVLSFLLKHFFLREILWTREMQFLKPCNFFCQKSENSTIKLRNCKHLIFSEANHLLKKLFWKHNLQFWQPSPKIVHQKAKNTTLKVRKHIKKSIFNPFLIWSKKCNFENRVKKQDQ